MKRRIDYDLHCAVVRASLQIASVIRENIRNFTNSSVFLEWMMCLQLGKIMNAKKKIDKMNASEKPAGFAS